MRTISESDVLTDLEQVKANGHELKAVQAARMSTFVLALLTTILTIISQ
ncbi:MAG: hypothetical protein ACYC21_07475 [Eubacteriales bacterium]